MVRTQAYLTKRQRDPLVGIAGTAGKKRSELIREAIHQLIDHARRWWQETMKCSIQGCPGSYEHRLIVHTVRRGGDVIVFEDVPAEVCDVCSDMLLTPETIRHLEKLMTLESKPQKHAPVYVYAQ